MASKRKTVSIRDIVVKANQVLARETISNDQKAILFLFVEDILFDAQQYAGFNWNDRNTMKIDNYSRHFYLSMDA